MVVGDFKLFHLFLPVLLPGLLSEKGRQGPAVDRTHNSSPQLDELCFCYLGAVLLSRSIRQQHISEVPLFRISWRGGFTMCRANTREHNLVQDEDD